MAAWINPSELRQAGIVCLGRYNWVHGWYMDMLQGGVLRIETVNPANKSNGTVASKPGIHPGEHLAARGGGGATWGKSNTIVRQRFRGRLRNRCTR